MNIIETSNLTKTFDTVTAVDHLSLVIHKGETFGLLGPNGSGKTTTIRLLNCMIKPTGGSATVNGYDIMRDGRLIKAITGLLAESPGIYDKLSPYEFLEFIGALYKVDKTILKDRILELLDFFSLTERKDFQIGSFSTGMKQKLLLASTLVHDPEIIFLDEPTSGLDPRAASVVKDLIVELARNFGKTIIICSHILPFVEEICDRIGIINWGKLVAVGTVPEILKSTGTANLEQAFIELTGGRVRPEMISWGTVN